MAKTVHCPACHGRMRPRGAGDQRARHFMHVDNLTGSSDVESCTGPDSLGEGDRHRLLKSLALSGLRTHFEEFDVASFDLEHEIDVSRGPSLYNTRRADAVVRFPGPITNPNRFFGIGVVVEVQQHNESKDVAAVTADYLKAGYSVYWAHESDFADTHFDTERFSQAFNERWPTAFAPYFIDADTALQTVKSVEYDPREMTDEEWSFIDPRPDCSHSLHQGHMGDPFCSDCGTTLGRHDTGRRMYLPLGAQ